MKKLIPFIAFLLIAPLLFGRAGEASPPPTRTPTPTQPASIEPFPAAPPCATHDNDTFHTLWNSADGCHYDHEHGQSPFTAEVAAAFPGLDLYALLGNVGIGHTNPSSEHENTSKHGGFKWNVQLTHPQGCQGFEGAATGVNGSAVEYHAFGNYQMELEGAIHSTAVLLRQCKTADPTDYGYIFVVQFQDYGQVVTPYQGTVMPYPYYTVPVYPSGAGPYLSVNCIDPDPVKKCRLSLQAAQNLPSQSTWTSKPTGTGARPASSTLFRLLFRGRDIYQNFLLADQAYPFTLLWLCSADGAVYNPAGCRYNNSTNQVGEIAGAIPAAWDGLAGWDSDSRVGRVTVEGYVTRFGVRNTNCAAPGVETDCFPIKLVSAFVGGYGSVLVFVPGKGVNIVPFIPERDLYFCGGVACAEGAAGAVPSGWIGSGN